MTILPASPEAGAPDTQLSGALDVAADLIAHGVPVFTLAPNAGYDRARPAGDGNSEYLHAKRWQTFRPDLNVLAMHAPGNALCAAMGHVFDGVDVDPRNGGDVADCVARLSALDVPIVGQVATPGGGAHLYVPAVGICKMAIKAAGVDYQGRGLDGEGTGFLYLPGTSRPKYDGAGYRWEVLPRWEIVEDLDPEDLAEIRDNVAAFLTGLGGKPRTRKPESAPAGGESVDVEDLAPWLRVELADVGPTWKRADGSETADRSERFYRLVAMCRRARLTQGQTVTALDPWCHAVGKYLGRVAEEVARVWDKVEPEPRTGTATPSAWEPPADNGGHRMDEEALAETPEGEDMAEEMPSSWEPVDLSAFLDGTYVAPVPELMPRQDGPCLLYRGKVHSFHGESESGKSLVLQAEAVRLIGAGGRVLFLDYESDAADVVGRIVRMGASHADVAARFTYVRPEGSPFTPANRAAFDSLLGQPWDLVIVDGMTDAYGSTTGEKSSDNDALAEFMRRFPRRIARRTGAAVVLIDHVVKDSESRGRYAIGGQHKLAGLDGAAYTVEVAEVCGVGLRGVLVLRIGKDRPGSIRPECGAWRKSDRTQEAARVVVDSTGAGTVVTVERFRESLTGEDGSEGFRPTHLMERVSRLVEDAGEPLSQRDLEGMAGGKVTYVREAVRLLVAEGYLSREKHGAAYLHRSAGPYREAADPALSASQSGGTHSSQESVRNPSATASRAKAPGRRDALNRGDSTASGTHSGRTRDALETESLDLSEWDSPNPWESGSESPPLHACAGPACSVPGCAAGVTA